MQIVVLPARTVYCCKKNGRTGCCCSATASNKPSGSTRVQMIVVFDIFVDAGVLSHFKIEERNFMIWVSKVCTFSLAVHP